MINYNSKLLDEEKLRINVLNRSFLFGDGLFETIIYANGKIPLFDFHWERLSLGIECLGFEVTFSKSILLNQILQTIAAQSNKANSYRVKLNIWRSGGGKYTPETNDSDYIITVEPTEIYAYGKITRCDVAKTVKLYAHPYSHLKTTSALNYVLAAQEKKARQAEELLLTSVDGQLAEATAANVFVYDYAKKLFITPPLSSGCINGVMRSAILQYLKQQQIKVVEQPIFMDSLGEDCSLMLSNVTGIRQVAYLEDIKLSTDESAALKLTQAVNYNAS